MELPSDLNALIGKRVYWCGSYFREGLIKKICKVEGLENAKVWLDDSNSDNWILFSELYFDAKSAFHAACDNEDYWRDIACGLLSLNKNSI